MAVITIGVSEAVVERLGGTALPLRKQLLKALRTGMRMGLIPEAAAEAADCQVVEQLPLSESDMQRLRALPAAPGIATCPHRIGSGLVQVVSRLASTNDKRNDNGGAHWMETPRPEQRSMAISSLSGACIRLALQETPP